MGTTACDPVERNEHYADAYGDIRRRAAILQVRDHVAKLPPRERRVIEWAFGLDGHAPVSQRYIARRLGVSQQAISKIKERGLEHLRDAYRASAVEVEALPEAA